MAKRLRFVDLGEFFTEMFNFSKGAKFAQLYTLTEVPLPKSNQYHGRVTKQSCINVQLNFNYSNAVNNQLEKEGKSRDFSAGKLPWGTRISGTPLLMHTKKGSTEPTAYLVARVLRFLAPTYFLDGLQVLDLPILEAIKEDLGSYSNAEHQGVEKEIVIRTYKLSSIKAITLDGETLVVEK